LIASFVASLSTKNTEAASKRFASNRVIRTLVLRKGESQLRAKAGTIPRVKAVRAAYSSTLDGSILRRFVVNARHIQLPAQEAAWLTTNRGRLSSFSALGVHRSHHTDRSTLSGTFVLVRHSGFNLTDSRKE
jgi:hypothetical protein